MMLSARIFGFFLAFLLLFFTVKTTFAQTNNSNSISNYTSPKNLQNLTQNVLVEVLSSVVCQITGVNYTNQSQGCLGIDPSTGELGFVQNGGGALGVTTRMISVLYTPPVHSYDFTRYVASNFGIAKPTHAQAGSGLIGLNPLVEVWVIFRNLVYLFFVIILAVIGVAIMLRVNVDPRTIMSVQNQIPKIIASLIFVTFSLAIAGFLIDIMWVSTYLAINTITQADPDVPSKIANQLYNNPLSFINYLFSGNNINGDSAGAIQSGVYNALNPPAVSPPVSDTCDTTNPLTVLGSCSGSDIFSLTIGSMINSVLTGILSFVLGVAAFFIISIAMLWSMIKLWFNLLKAYIMILFTIALAPIWIIIGLIPGNQSDQQSMGFENWVRELLGNLMAFPAVIAFFLMGKLFVSQFGNVPQADFQTRFIPPLIGGAADTDKIGALIGLGIILASPRIVELTKQAFKKRYQAKEDQTTKQGLQGSQILGGAILGKMYYRDRGGQLQGPLGGAFQGKFATSTRRGSGLVRTVLGIRPRTP